MTLLRLMLVCCLFLSYSPTAGHAEQPAISPKVQSLLQLLTDKDVQDWLKARPPADDLAIRPTVMTQPGALLSTRLQEIRQHLQDVIHAVPLIPGEIANAATTLRAATQGFSFFLTPT